MQIVLAHQIPRMTKTRTLFMRLSRQAVILESVHFGCGLFVIRCPHISGAEGQKEVFEENGFKVTRITGMFYGTEIAIWYPNPFYDKRMKVRLQKEN
eukprot:1177267-Prorocentrum_minimum.AAC.5